MLPSLGTCECNRFMVKTWFSARHGGSICNHSAQDAEAGGLLQVSGHTGHHSEFQVNLRLYCETKQQTPNKQKGLRDGSRSKNTKDLILNLNVHKKAGHDLTSSKPSAVLCRDVRVPGACWLPAQCQV